MTYLDIVNNILRRLRERTVSTVDETSYSTLVGILVNDAKEEVENAWNWSSLRQTLTISTTSGTYSYELPATQSRLTVLDVANDTDNFFLEYKPSIEMNRLFLTTAVSSASPRYYSFDGVASDLDTKVRFHPIPDGVYSIDFNIVLRPSALVNNTDLLTVPSQPVLHLAYAKAVEERGEDGGVPALSAYNTAQRSLSDAISLDQGKHPEELIWNAP